MVKGIIFDFDGVIVDTERKKFKDLKAILKKYNYTLDNKFFPDFIGKKTAHFLNEKFSSMNKDLIKKITEDRRKSQYSKFNTYTLIPGIQELLKYIRSKKLIIALTTGTRKDIVEEILKINSLKKYFNILVTGEDFHTSKPDPECYKVTLDKIKLPPEEVIVIEDSLAGIRAAKKAGCTVFALQVYFDKDYLNEADKILKDHTELQKHIMDLY